MSIAGVPVRRTSADQADKPLGRCTEDLLRRLGRTDEAAVAYREALELAATDAERRYLTRRLTEMTGSA